MGRDIYKLIIRASQPQRNPTGVAENGIECDERKLILDKFQVEVLRPQVLIWPSIVHTAITVSILSYLGTQNHICVVILLEKADGQVLIKELQGIHPVYCICF